MTKNLSIKNFFLLCVPVPYRSEYQNGKGFVHHKIEVKGPCTDCILTYLFAALKCGPNENVNGLIRQYFTKSMDFTAITEEQIKSIERKLNTRPRKRYGYESPVGMMNKLLAEENLHS